MTKIIDINKGLTFKVEPSKSKFLQELKAILRELNVAYHDDCCGETFCPAVTPCGAATGSYVYNTGLASQDWIIDHGLHFYPNVQAIATDGTNLVGTIAYPSIDTVTIHFNTPQTGTAYLS